LSDKRGSIKVILLIEFVPISRISGAVKCLSVSVQHNVGVGLNYTTQLVQLKCLCVIFVRRPHITAMW